MEEHHDHDHQHQHQHGPAGSLISIAFMATLHCMVGCGIGEVAGMAIGTALGWTNLNTIILAVILAFITGFAFTMRPLLKSSMGVAQALRIALAADTVSITIMEIVDNAVIVIIPGALDAGLDDWLFWISMAVALGIAVIFAFPANKWLIGRGKGHAVMHEFH